MRWPRSRPGAVRWLVKGYPEVDLDLRAGDPHLLDHKPDQPLALLEVESVQRGENAPREVPDPASEPALLEQRLLLLTEIVPLRSEPGPA